MKDVVFLITVVTAVIAGNVYRDTPFSNILRLVVMWSFATAILYGSVVMVGWPRQLIARNPHVGTTRPVIARVFGFLGIILGLFLVAVAAFTHAPYPLGWPALLMGGLASVLTIGLLLKHL